MTARDPRDIADIFGPLIPARDHNGASFWAVPGVTENQLRRNLASVAHAYGWYVVEEEVVPGWGRIDIVLHDFDGPRLIELKLDLTKPARIRKAFQQADGYGRWWARRYGQPVSAHIVGLKADVDAVKIVGAAYPEIGWGTCGEFLRDLRIWGTDRARADRRARSESRADAIQTVLDAYRAAAGAVPSDAAALTAVGGAE